MKNNQLIKTFLITIATLYLALPVTAQNKRKDDIRISIIKEIINTLKETKLDKEFHVDTSNLSIGIYEPLLGKHYDIPIMRAKFQVNQNIFSVKDKFIMQQYILHQFDSQISEANVNDIQISKINQTPTDAQAGSSSSQKDTEITDNTFDVFILTGTAKINLVSITFAKKSNKIIFVNVSL